MDKKYTIIATIIILAIGGGIYAWQNNTGPYKGWKTYRNDEVGYSVRYPGEYVANISDYAPGTDLRGNVVLQKLEITDREFPYYVKISFTAYDNSDMLSAEKWVEKEIDPYIFRPASTQRRTTMEIDGFSGFRVEMNNGQSIVVIIQRKEKIFEVGLGVYDREKTAEGRKTFERVLNSLRID
ncbi:MAG: hypothetical protein Q8R20_02065 [Nanoarchaeota archaeon]|nr:hypothetical protein [Nanoarchaeota archaeon]